MNSYDIKCRIIEEELQSIWPDWHVARRLGGGTFGDVFQIYRDNFGIRVDSALKIIQVDQGTADYALTQVLPINRKDDQEIEDSRCPEIPDALQNEIGILEALRGAPNIVAVEDYRFKQDESVSSLFIRMELLTSLQDILQGRHEQNNLYSIREIRKLGREICTALMYCEKKGIIHRDIKPANLFLDKFGSYKVGDFGASKRMDTLLTEQTMTGIGTISYMAPEIFQGRSYNNTVDIYSLGLVLYQFLNKGRMPFLPAEGSYTGQDVDRANFRRLHGTPVPELTGKMLREEQIDSRLDAAVRKACAINPEDRFQTSKEFYDALGLTGLEEKKSVPADMPLHRQKNGHSHIKKFVTGAAIVMILGAAVLAVRQGSGKASGSSSSSFSGPFSTSSSGASSDDASGLDQTNSKSGGEDIAAAADEQMNETGSGGGEESVTSVASVQMDEAVSDTDAEETALETDDSILVQITDSWEEIIAAGEDGTYIDKYKIGDKKDLDLGEEGIIEMELVAFDADELADGSGKAHMTWIANELLNSEQAMNASYYDRTCWPDSYMRAWLRETVLPLFPETVRSNIKEVKKYSYSYFDQSTVASVDALWIPSVREIYGDSDYHGSNLEDKGVSYSIGISERSMRKKHINNLSTSWWLRSNDNVGYEGGSYADNNDGVVIGFCF